MCVCVCTMLIVCEINNNIANQTNFILYSKPQSHIFYFKDSKLLFIKY